MNASVVTATELRTDVRPWRPWLRWFSLGFVLSLLFGGLVASRQPQLYQARAALLVGPSLQSASPDASAIEAATGLTRVYAGLAHRPLVLQAVVDELHLPQGPDQLATRLNAVALPESQVLEIVAVDADPWTAQAIANATARTLVGKAPAARDDVQAERAYTARQLAEVQKSIDSLEGQLRNVETSLNWGEQQPAEGRGPDVAALQAMLDAQRATYTGLLASYRGATSNGLTLIEPATTATPVGRPAALILALSGMAGLVLSGAGVAAARSLDDALRWQGPEQQDCLGLPILGALGTVPDDWVPLFYPRDPLSPGAEALRDVLANVYLAGPAGASQAVLVTSPAEGEGKSLLAANLAIAMAATGAQVLLVDANLRRPALHKLLGVKNERGLAEALLDRHARPQAALSRAIRRAGRPRLWLISAGRQTMESPLALVSARLRELLRLAKQRFQLVIVDGPAEGVSTDAGALASLADATLLVLREGTTRQDRAWHSRQALAGRAGVRLVGVVFNRAHRASVRPITATPLLADRFLSRLPDARVPAPDAPGRRHAAGRKGKPRAAGKGTVAVARPKAARAAGAGNQVAAASTETRKSAAARAKATPSAERPRGPQPAIQGTGASPKTGI